MKIQTDNNAARSLNRLIEALWRDQPRPGESVDDYRLNFELAAARRPLADCVETTPLSVDRMDAELCSPRGPMQRPVVVLYLHGGGFISGSLNTSRPLATHLSKHLGARVLVPKYGLSPECPYPAGLEDAVRSYEWLLSRTDLPILLCGDSAGAALAVGTCLTARSRGLPQPCGLISISGWMDLALTSPSIQSVGPRDPLVKRWLLEEMAGYYLDGGDAFDSLASPLYADMTDLPPMLLQVATCEALLDDSRRLAERAEACGVDVTLQLWDEVMHVWHCFAPALPQANEALEAIASWAQDRLELAVGVVSETSLDLR